MFKQQVISNAKLFSFLEQGASLLTGNLRLSRFVGEKFDRHVVASEQLVWHTPVIMPLQNWLEKTRETLLINCVIDADVLLNPQQEILLWEDIIRHSDEGSILLRPHATARQVQQAWQLLYSWRLENASDLHGLNKDSRVFVKWSKKFRQRCIDNHWISSAQVPNQLQHALSNNNAFSGKKIILAGFDELTPQQEYLFSALSDAGSTILWVTLEEENKKEKENKILVECANERDEIFCMARWVRQYLGNNRETSIAIVVPDLERKRSIIMRELSSLLHSDTSFFFNISLGLPLVKYPLIQTAFHLLTFIDVRIDISIASSLLLSPFIFGWEIESHQRALLDIRLREIGETEVSLRTLIYFSEQETKVWFCPLLAEHFRALRHFIDSLSARDSAGHWAEQFSRYLNTAGWSSGRSLSSEEYQTLGAWKELLVEFSRFDLISETMSMKQGLGHLRQLASEKMFQPESENTAVQVLGLYEASGLHFDALWLMGMNDTTWPASAHPNPFISLALQRKHEMPHATAARELRVARHLTQRLLTSAETVIVSYPLTTYGSETETLRPSTLFNTLPHCQPEYWQGASWQDLIFKKQELEFLINDSAPKIFLKDESIRGGSSIIRLQSNCPFRAFAELRLGARSIAEVDIGLNAMTRGTLVHRVLELVWDTIETQDCLLQLYQQDSLANLVEKLCGIAIKEIHQQLPKQFSGEYLKLEMKRLQDYVMRWLSIEKDRSPFRVIETEQLIETEVSGVPIRLKLDRIDELDDGSYLVIDYKTGKVTASQWFGDRPEEPQLPLYASAVNERLAGILFAQLQSEKLAFKGICEVADQIPDVKSYEDMKQTKDMPSWDAVLENWKTTVEKLAESFKAGNADVDPLKPSSTCRYCELSTLCRLHEQNRLQEEVSEVEV